MLMVRNDPFPYRELQHITRNPAMANHRKAMTPQMPKGMTTESGPL